MSRHPARPCTGLPGVPCGQPTRNAGGRCDECSPTHERRRHNQAYDSAEYRRARAEAVAAYVARFGNWCAGWLVAGHASTDLTADHPESLAFGGPAIQAFTIYCRACNSRRGAKHAAIA